MDQELKEKLLSYVNNAEAFLQAEVPAFFTEYVNYHFYAELLSCISSLVMILIMVFIIRCLYLGYINECFKNTSRDFREVATVFTSIGYVIATFIIFIQLCCVYSSTKMMIKTSIAPRVFVFDKIVEMKIDK